jgi:hypothetical protein
VSAPIYRSYAARGAGHVAHERLWIFGDNILECERALDLIAESFDASRDRIQLVPGPLVSPEYVIKTPSSGEIQVRLFPGYGRWNFDVAQLLISRGARLREATDALVVDASTSDLVVAFEFCGALPAGNQAWQRCGRALACADSGTPYLYFAEAGGVELNADRSIRAPRFPNPVAPFSYRTLGSSSRSLAVPVFTRSPSIQKAVEREFDEAFADHEALRVIRSAVANATIAPELVDALLDKAVTFVRLLALKRRQDDSLGPDEWDQLARVGSGRARAEWLLARKLAWRKRVSIGTDSIRQLIDETIRIGAVAVGSTNIPVCLLSGGRRSELASVLERLYPGRLSEAFLEWVRARDETPLVIIWVAGFKPGGDDSRPDRGLVPMARMLFDEGADYLAVIYGPASAEAWGQLEANPLGLAGRNGLWEGIIGLTDAVLADSSTAGALASVGLLMPEPQSPDPFTSHFDPDALPRLGEHDIDSVIHQALGTNPEELIFEAFCNPPGGDWSGISIQNQPGGEIYRWTSLPRVTQTATQKRPDHVIVLQGQTPPLVLCVESKDAPTDLEPLIGPRVKSYVHELLCVEPNISRADPRGSWRIFEGSYSSSVQLISGAVVRYTDNLDLARVQERADVDLMLAAAFDASGRCTLHARARPEAYSALASINAACARFGGWLKVDEH